MSKPLVKKNISNAKGNKAAGLNNKLSEDMVPIISSSKTKSRTPLPSTTQGTQAPSTARTSGASSATSPSPR